MKTLYGGVDLHANNSVIVILDEQDQVVFQKRLPNTLDEIFLHLAGYRAQLQGLVVESTYNWYWLVDGLMEAGYSVQLANPAAIKRYDGLKHTNDQSDARWLAHLLRLGLVATGYIYPKEDRAVRDLLRKRSQLDRQKTMHLLSIQGLLARNTGTSLSGNRVKQLTPEGVAALVPEPDRALAIRSNLTVLHCLKEEITRLARTVKARLRVKPAFQSLLTVNGIGETLALTIMLETGDIRRFASVGHFASYCRCVDSQRLSNHKCKSRGNVKNGNKYLAWAFIEAATFAVRYSPPIRRFHQRKLAKTQKVVALKTVAHKLARACFYIMRDRVPFDVTRAFT